MEDRLNLPGHGKRGKFGPGALLVSAVLLLLGMTLFGSFVIGSAGGWATSPPATEPVVGASEKTVIPQLRNLAAAGARGDGKGLIQEVNRRLEWQYRGATYCLSITVPARLLAWDREVKNMVRSFYESNAGTQYRMLSGMDEWQRKLILSRSEEAKGNVVPWVTEPLNYQFAGLIAQELARLARARNFNRFDKAELVLSFVGGAIPYKLADLQLPAQTLIDDGDCECKSVLLAAILHNMGYQVALLTYPRHMAVGIVFSEEEIPPGRKVSYYKHNGLNYYFAETTAPGWRVGQASDKSNQKEAYVFPVD